MGRRKPIKKQLHTFFNNLEPHAPHESDRNLVIGCSVIDGLLGFSSTSGDLYEVRGEEVKRIYASLSEAIQTAKTDDAYRAFCKMHERIGPELQAYFADPQHNLGESKLIADISSRLADRFSKTYEDRLRRDGSSLYLAVMDHGPVTGSRAAQLHDYRLIERIFSGGRR